MYLLMYIYCIPGAKRGYYGFIIVVVRRDFLLATYSPHFFPDFFHIWQVASYGGGVLQRFFGYSETKRFS